MSGVDKSRSTEMRFKEFQLSVKSDLKTNYDLIAIDDGSTVEQIDDLSMAIMAFGFILIVTTHKGVKELETVDRSAFDVMVCSYSYTGAITWKLHAGADCWRFPVKPKDGTSGKIHTENHCCRT